MLSSGVRAIPSRTSWTLLHSVPTWNLLVTARPFCKAPPFWSNSDNYQNYNNLCFRKKVVFWILVLTLRCCTRDCKQAHATDYSSITWQSVCLLPLNLIGKDFCHASRAWTRLRNLQRLSSYALIAHLINFLFGVPHSKPETFENQPARESAFPPSPPLLTLPPWPLTFLLCDTQDGIRHTMQA